MPDESLYQGTIFFCDTSTGDEAAVAVQVAFTEDGTSYTIRSLANDHPPVTLHSGDRAQCDFLRRLMATMLRVSVPA